MNNPQAVTPKKNNNTVILIAGGLLILGVCCCIVFALVNSGGLSTDIQIKYVIAGTATSALVTYFNETGGTEQATTNLPFNKEFTVSPGAALSLVAQNNGSGSITCEIWVNGTMTKTSTSTAEFGVVTCSDFAK